MATLDSIKPLLLDTSFTIFMATWCSDGKAQVPRFYRILDELDYDTSKVNLYALDKKKQSPSKLEKEYNVLYVPTILVLRNDSIKNRIVEIPIKSLEQDLLDILQGKSYKHAYQE